MTDKSEMIFGVRAVIEAIQAGKEIDKILAVNFLSKYKQLAIGAIIYVM